jgi:alkylhydroperoxidase family enzyme
MPRLPILTKDSAPDATRSVLADLERRSLTPGVLLNLHAQMANAPALLLGYMGMRHAIEEHGSLDAKIRTAVMLTTSVTNGARYSRALNAILAERAGWTGDEVEALDNGRDSGDSRIAALLDVVRQAAGHAGRVNEATWSAAQAAGWSSAQLADAFASIALTTAIDYFVHFAATPLDIHVPAHSRS